jgi:DNA repair photolyase
MTRLPIISDALREEATTVTAHGDGHQFEIQLGHLCNNRCLFCSSGQLSARKVARTVALDPVVEAIVKARASGARRLTFLGGEPTTQRSFLPALEAAVAQGFEEIVIFTNGVMFPVEGFIERVVAMGRFEWRVSIQGGDEAAHVAVTQRPDSFRRIVHGLEKLQALGQRVTVNLCVNEASYRSLPKYPDLVARYGVQQLHVDIVRPSSTGDRDADYLRAIMPRYTDMAPSFDAMLTRFARELPGFDVNVGNLPYCVLPAWAERIHHGGEETVTQACDTEGLEVAVDKYAWHASMRRHVPACEGCAFRARCSGVFGEYLALYGDGEFRAVPPEALAALPPTPGPRGRAPAAPVVRASERYGAELFAPLLRAQPPGSRWRVVSHDTEQGLCISLACGARVLLVEFEPRDESRPCFARTRRFNVSVRPRFDDGDLDDAERRLVMGVVGVVGAREGALPVIAPRPEPVRGSAVRAVRASRVLVPEGRGQYYLNPYAGCMIGCPYCYVDERADLSRALEGVARHAWGRWVDVKVDAPEVLRREVRDLPPGPVRMSPILTDPYQPLERTYRVTRGCLEVLLEAGFSPVILTRGARVVEDLDLLARFSRAAVGLSVPTDDDSVRARFEPGADPVDARLDALARLHGAGLRTFLAVQPMLPMDPARLVARTAPHVHTVRIDRMHGVEGLRGLYESAGCVEAMEDAFFARTEAALRAGFAAHGVRVDALDDMDALLGGAR